MKVFSGLIKCGIWPSGVVNVVGLQLRHLQRLRCFARNRGFVGSSPSFGSDVFDLAIRHGGQPCQDIAQVAIWLDTVAAATLNDRVDNRTAFSGVGVSEEQPVLSFMERFS
jgi:hypothetical protein